MNLVGCLEYGKKRGAETVTDAVYLTLSDSFEAEGAEEKLFYEYVAFRCMRKFEDSPAWPMSRYEDIGIDEALVLGKFDFEEIEDMAEGFEEGHITFMKPFELTRYDDSNYRSTADFEKDFNNESYRGFFITSIREIQDVLEDFDYWDSLAILSIISMASESYKKTFKAADIRECKTIGDLCKLILD